MKSSRIGSAVVGMAAAAVGVLITGVPAGPVAGASKGAPDPKFNRVEGDAPKGEAAGKGAPLIKPLTVEGKVQAGHYKFDAGLDRVYRIRVDGSGFRPNVSLTGGRFALSTQENEGDTFIGTFVPQTARNISVKILPNLWDDIPDEALDYEVTVDALPVSDKPLFEKSDKLAPTDPPFKSEDSFRNNAGPHKSYEVRLPARTVCIIDLRRAGEWDPYLLVQDADGKVVASDDDSGGNGNDRIVFQPRRATTYRIVALVRDKDADLGDFTLSVRTVGSATEKPLTHKGKMTVPTAKFDPDPARLYRIRVEGAGYSPEVRLTRGDLRNVTSENENETRIGYLMPTEARTTRVRVIPGDLDEAGSEPLDTKIVVEPLSFAEKPLLSETGKFAETDKPYENDDNKLDGVHRAFAVRLEPRKVYVIEVKGRDGFDPWVGLESPEGKLVASDRWSGIRNTARLVLAVRRAGVHKVIAANPGREAKGPDAAKEYTVTVRVAE